MLEAEPEEEVEEVEEEVEEDWQKQRSVQYVSIESGNRLPMQKICPDAQYLCNHLAKVMPCDDYVFVDMSLVLKRSPQRCARILCARFAVLKLYEGDICLMQRLASTPARAEEGVNVLLVLRFISSHVEVTH